MYRGNENENENVPVKPWSRDIFGVIMTQSSR